MSTTASKFASRIGNASTAPTCPYCAKPAVLIEGAELYPHIPALANRKFWRCHHCDAHVGCHEAGCFIRHSSGAKIVSDGTLPLGRLANAELRKLKQRAHDAFDPIWKGDGRFMSRPEAYAWLAGRLNIEPDRMHIGELDPAGCRAVIDAAMQARVMRGRSLRRRPSAR